MERGLYRNQRAAKGALHSQLTNMIEEFRSRKFGLTRERTAPRDTVKEIYGTASGAEGAKVNAQAWQKTMDWWLGMMKDAGVNIRALADWRLPQEFNVLRLREMGQQGFVAAMTERWESGRVRLRDFASEADNGYLMPGREVWRAEGVLRDEDRVREILTKAYDSVVTGGANMIEPGITTRDSLASRYNRRRVFEWPTAESYFDFADTFGNGSQNLGEAFTRHIGRMADDLGTAQVLGPNADTTMQTLLQYGRSKGLSEGQINALDKLYFHVSGKAHEPVRVTFANTAQGVRSGLSAVQLGSATLSSLSDFATLRATASFNGLGRVRVMREYLAELVGGKNARREATQMALINEAGLRGTRDNFDEVLTANPGGMHKGSFWEAASGGFARLTGQAAEFVMRVTALEHHSASARGAWGKGQLANLANHADIGFEALPGRLGYFLQRYGIDAREWDVLRTKAMHGEKLFMDPAYLAWAGEAADRRPALKLIGAIDAESRYAVPEGGPTTQAVLFGGSRPGELPGEIARSVQYKGFALSASIFQGFRALDPLWQREGAMARGRYLATMTIETIVAGALSYQLLNIIAGRDLEAMDTPYFWLKAAAKGGVGGMLGDQLKVMFQTQSMADAARNMTPMAGLATNAYSLAFGNLTQLDAGERTNFGREAVRFGQQYSPTQVAGRLWYTRLAMDRLVWDTLQRMVDPDAGGAFSRIEQRARKQTGTQYWWRPGQTEPSRPPDLGAALGR